MSLVAGNTMCLDYDHCDVSFGKGDTRGIVHIAIHIRSRELLKCDSAGSFKRRNAYRIMSRDEQVVRRMERFSKQ